MAYTVEKLLSDAATLVSRLKEHDTMADILISQTDNLQKRMDAMKEVPPVYTMCNVFSTLIMSFCNLNIDSYLWHVQAVKINFDMLYISFFFVS